MAPSEIIHFLTDKHYPALIQLAEQLNIHLPASVKVNTSAHLPLDEIEKEYRKLVSLVKGQIKKHTRILFPFLDNVLEDGKVPSEVLSDLEIEISEIHTRHMQMRTHLAMLSSLSNNYTPGPNSSESMKVAFAELHSLELQLYRLFYIEDVLLLPKISKLTFCRESIPGMRRIPRSV